MKTRPKSAKSPFEIAFETKQTFNRNRQFLDINKTVFLDRQYSALRRAPIKTDSNHISEKINSSFMNTTAELTQRAHKTISRHKSGKSNNTIFQLNMQSDINQPEDQEQSQVRDKISPAPRGRSFSIEKMTSREYHHRLKNKAVSDERRFNNFQKFKPGAPLYCSYDNMIDAKKDAVNPYLQLQYSTHKLYEEYYYRRTTNNCRVDYQSEKKLNHQRVYFSPRREENNCATDSDPKKVDEALKKVQGSGKPSSMTQFYRNTGRQLPCQMEMREMNEMTNFWKDETGHIQRKKQDYQTRKIKQQLSTKRVNKIKYSKNQQQISHQRSEVCDELYFRRFKF